MGVLTISFSFVEKVCLQDMLCGLVPSATGLPGDGANFSLGCIKTVLSAESDTRLVCFF